MTRAAVAVVVAAAAASAVHKNVRRKRLWKRFDDFVAIKKKGRQRLQVWVCGMLLTTIVSRSQKHE